jgi:hypothetical protein
MAELYPRQRCWRFKIAIQRQFLGNTPEWMQVSEQLQLGKGQCQFW